jgi:integrase/recombinase XerD
VGRYELFGHEHYHYFGWDIGFFMHMALIISKGYQPLCPSKGLTPSTRPSIITQDILRSGGMVMKGTIICNKCRKKMDGVCSCGNYRCLIRVYWKKKYYEFRRDKDGDVLTYQKATNRLIEISNAMKEHTFNPTDYDDSQVKERKFSFMMEKWLNQKECEEQNNELSPETLRCYYSYNRNYFSYFHKYDVREIRYEQLEDFKDNLPNHLKIKMKKNILNALHSFFNWIRKRGIINDIPLFPQIKGDDSQVMTAIDLDSQNEALLKIPEKHRDFFTVLFETGVRISEACTFKVKDVDVANQQILVQRTWSGAKLVETTKGRNKKWIPLSDRAYDLVLSSIKNKLPDSFIFINFRTKRPYKPEFLRRLWKKHSGVQVKLYEASRHSFCTQLVEGGTSLSDAQQLMRHADVRSTLRYFHGNISRLRQTVNQRGKAINKTAKVIPLISKDTK